MNPKRSTKPNQTSRLSRKSAAFTISTSDEDRAQQYADIAATGDEDNAECCIADSFREFPPAL